MSLSGQSGVVPDHNNIKMDSLQVAGITGDVGGIINYTNIAPQDNINSVFIILEILGSEYCSGYIDEGTLIFSVRCEV